MPKVRTLTDEARARESFKHVLGIKMAENDMQHYSDLADKVHTDRGNVYNWNHNPDSIPVAKLREIFKALHYTAEDVYEACGFGRPT